MQDFNGGEALELQARVHGAQRLEHVRVIAEREGRVQAADDVQFGDANIQGFAGLLDDLVHGELEAVGVALFAGEGAELAGEDAVVRVVDVTVDDVVEAIARLFLAGEVGDGADGIDILALEQAEGVGLGDASTGGDLVIEVAQGVVLGEKVHAIFLTEFDDAGFAPGKCSRKHHPFEFHRDVCYGVRLHQGQAVDVFRQSCFAGRRGCRFDIHPRLGIFEDVRCPRAALLVARGPGVRPFSASDWLRTQARPPRQNGPNSGVIQTESNRLFYQRWRKLGWSAGTRTCPPPGTIRHRDGSGDIFPAHGERVRKSTPESGKIRPNQTKSDPPSLGASEGRPSHEVGLEEPTESLYSGPDSMDRQKRRNGRGYLNGRNLCWGIL